MLLRGWITLALVVGLARSAGSAVPDSVATAPLTRPRPTASAPT